MAEIIPMTEEQKFQLEIYKLVMNQNAAAEEAFQFIGTDELKLELFKIHFQSGGANSDITTRTIVTNGAIVIHTQRLKSDPGGNLLS
ncbi:DUF2560 family protein [Escherichia coli]|nr:DUF2560 family protein [Escherichia coli]